MENEINTRDLARLLDVSSKTLSAWAVDGIVTRLAHGKYDLTRSVRGFVQHMRGLVDARGGEGPAAAVAAERIALLKLQSEKAEFELQKMAGTLINVDEVEAHKVAEWRKLRTLMMTLPTRIGSLAGLTAQQTAVADDEVRAVLNEMAASDYDPPTEAEIAACMAIRLRRVNGASGKPA